MIATPLVLLLVAFVLYSSIGSYVAVWTWTLLDPRYTPLAFPLAVWSGVSWPVTVPLMLALLPAPVPTDPVLPVAIQVRR